MTARRAQTAASPNCFVDSRARSLIAAVSDLKRRDPAESIKLTARWRKRRVSSLAVSSSTLVDEGDPTSTELLEDDREGVLDATEDVGWLLVSATVLEVEEGIRLKMPVAVPVAGASWKSRRRERARKREEGGRDSLWQRVGRKKSLGRRLDRRQRTRPALAETSSNPIAIVIGKSVSSRKLGSLPQYRSNVCMTVDVIVSSPYLS